LHTKVIVIFFVNIIFFDNNTLITCSDSLLGVQDSQYQPSVKFQNKCDHIHANCEPDQLDYFYGYYSNRAGRVLRLEYDHAVGEYL